MTGVQPAHDLVVHCAVLVHRQYGGAEGLSRLVRHVVHLAGLVVHAAVSSAVQQHVVGGLQEDDLVGDDAHALQCGSLWPCVWEAVQQPPTCLAVGPLQPPAQQLQEVVVRHRLAAVHVLLGLQAQGGARLHLLVQQVTHIDVRQAKALGQQLALRGLAAACRAQHHDSQGVLAMHTERGVPQRPAVPPNKVLDHHVRVVLVHGLCKPGKGCCCVCSVVDPLVKQALCT
mmetsp:Transcript_29510/g.65343  ORF Transcript_29510/g.65343 Transcript_29510/m.65343 type:complete len:229 (-) Transcript_29510:1003-1689(-)